MVESIRRDMRQEAEAPWESEILLRYQQGAWSGTTASHSVRVRKLTRLAESIGDDGRMPHKQSKDRSQPDTEGWGPGGAQHADEVDGQGRAHQLVGRTCVYAQRLHVRQYIHLHMNIPHKL